MNKKEDLKLSFVGQLGRAMDKAHMNVSTLAKKIDVGEGTIWKYLDWQSPNLPTMHTLYKMCLVLDVSADYFLFGGGERG